MIRHGDNVVNFNKIRGTQLANIQTVIRKRPTTKFSTGLSMEAQEAMQQVVEETKIEQNARRGKRGSKGNVLFSDTVQVQICRGGSNTRPLGFFDILKENSVGACARSPRSPAGVDNVIRDESINNSRRYGNVTVPGISGGGAGSLSLAVDQVEMANRPGGGVRERKTSKGEDGRKDGRLK